VTERGLRVGLAAPDPVKIVADADDLGDLVELPSKSATTFGSNLTVQASRATCGAPALVISQSLPL
jgi:hypothetical protein